MSHSIDAQLEGAGVLPEDVRLRVDGLDQAMVVTKRDWFSFEPGAVQRIGLREVTKVSLDKTYVLTVRNPTGVGLETGVRSFDMNELKAFLAGVKEAIAEVKTRSTTGIRPAPTTPLGAVVVPEAGAINPPVSSVPIAPPADPLTTNEKPNTDSLIRSRSTMNLPPIPKAETGLRSSGVNWSAKKDSGDEVEAALRERASEIPVKPAPIEPMLERNNFDKTPMPTEPLTQLPEPIMNETIRKEPVWGVPAPEHAPDLDPALLATPIPLNAPNQMVFPAQSTMLDVVNHGMSNQGLKSFPGLAPFARWLKFLSPIAGLLGAASAGLFLNERLNLIDSSDLMTRLSGLAPLDWAAGLGIFVVSLMLCVMAWGLGEWFSSLVKPH